MKMKKMLVIMYAVAMLLLSVSCEGRGQPELESPPAMNAVPEVKLPESRQDTMQTEPEVTEKPAVGAVPELAVTPAPSDDMPQPIETDSVPVQVPQPVHVHDWRPVTQVVHHEAVTEQVKVVDQPATEGHYEGGSYEVMVCRCGEVFTTNDAWLAHAHTGGADEHGGFTTSVRSNQVWVEGTPEVSHYETRVVSDAWDEEVITGLVCASCGADG